MLFMLNKPMTEAQFDEIKSRAESFYKSCGKVFCPYFNEMVSFNAKGLYHLKFNSSHLARTREEQFIRFKLIYLAPEVIRLSRTLQGITHTKNFELFKTNNRTERVLKTVSYYEFIAILENKRVRVVIKQIENNPKYFWSIIPFWKTDKVTFQRKMHSPNLEND